MVRLEAEALAEEVQEQVVVEEVAVQELEEVQVQELEEVEALVVVVLGLEGLELELALALVPVLVPAVVLWLVCP